MTRLATFSDFALLAKRCSARAEAKSVAGQFLGPTQTIQIDRLAGNR
jgi:hypothetical protein